MCVVVSDVPSQLPVERICKLCESKFGHAVVGDEKHALGASERGHKSKMDLHVDMQCMLIAAEVVFPDDCNYLWDLLGHLHKLPESVQLVIWRRLGRVMFAIGEEIRAETGITLKQLAKDNKVLKQRVLLPLGLSFSWADPDPYHHLFACAEYLLR